MDGIRWHLVATYTILTLLLIPVSYLTLCSQLNTTTVCTAMYGDLANHTLSSHPRRHIHEHCLLALMRPIRRFVPHQPRDIYMKVRSGYILLRYTDRVSLVTPLGRWLFHHIIRALIQCFNPHFSLPQIYIYNIYNIYIYTFIFFVLLTCLLLRNSKDLRNTRELERGVYCNTTDTWGSHLDRSRCETPATSSPFSLANPRVVGYVACRTRPSRRELPKSLSLRGQGLYI